MSRHLFWLSLCLIGLIRLEASGGDATPLAKLKALYITGGPYHDFTNLAPLLTAKISEFANVEWEVKWGPEVLTDPKFGQAYDAVVYNMCFDEPHLPSMNNILTLTREGKPTVAIHCAVHSFKQSDEWRSLVGEVSRIHDRYQGFATQKVIKDHPVMQSFPDNWQTQGDELYQTIQMGPEAKSLLKATSPSTGVEHVVCWANQYGKGRVFGTTLGHDLKTAQQTDYHRLLAYGLLWACDKLDERGKPLLGYEGRRKE